MPKYDPLFSIWAPRLLSVLRVVVALLYVQHGTQKLLGFPGTPQVSAPLASLSGLSGPIELIGGLLLLLGLFTRPVAFLLSGEMAVAYFARHLALSFFPLLNRGELPALYCWVFLYFAVAGGGPWSLDALWAGRKAHYPR